MTARPLQAFADGGSFFESPRWRRGRWWVTDYYRHAVLAYDEAGREQLAIDVGDRPSGLGWLPDDSLLIACADSQRILRWSREAGFERHADLRALVAGPLNDMTVDEEGRAYVGEHGFAYESGAPFAPARVVRVDPTGDAKVVAEDLWFPNGAVLDGRTLIVGESFAGRYTALELDASGDVVARRLWAQLSVPPADTALPGLIERLDFVPDGCALDAEGRIWSCDAAHQRCCLVAPGGAIVAEIRAPEGLELIACALGGPDGRTLLLCAGPPFTHDYATTRDCVLLTTTVETPSKETLPA